MPQAAKSWGDRPSKKKPAAPADLDRFLGGEKTKRLNVDIPEALHRRLKAGCAIEGREIKDVMAELIEARFPAR